MELENQFGPIHPVPHVESLFDRPEMPASIVTDDPTVSEAFLVDAAIVGDAIIDDGITGIRKVKHEALKGARMLGGVITTFFKESREQISEGENLREKITIGAAVGSIAMMAVGGQLADRFRVPESANIPNAITVAKEHGNPAGAVALGLGVYAAQGVIGAAWGAGIKRFGQTANVFDETYPGYKATLAEENAGYVKTLWRHSVIGLGIGNTMFVAAEVLDKPDMSYFDVVKTSNRSAKRVGAAATAVAFGVLTAAEANYDRNILWWSVPDVVDAIHQPKTWIFIGVGAEIVPRVFGLGYKGIKAIPRTIGKGAKGLKSLVSRQPETQEQE